MDELQAFYDAAFPRLDEAMAYLDKFELSALPEDAAALAVALLLPGQRVLSRSRCGASPGCPTAVQPAWTWWSSRRSDAAPFTAGGLVPVVAGWDPEALRSVG